MFDLIFNKYYIKSSDYIYIIIIRISLVISSLKVNKESKFFYLQLESSLEVYIFLVRWIGRDRCWRKLEYN